MKKLTAGIFTVLLGIVSVSAADAAITSKKYVDDLVGTKADASTVTAIDGRVTQNTTNITNLTKTVGDNKAATDTAIEGINTNITNLTEQVSNLTTGDNNVAAQITKALENYDTKTEVDAKVKVVSDALDTYKTSNDAALGLKADAANVYTKTAADAAFDAKGSAAGVQTSINATIGEVAEGKTVVEMINDAKTAATYDDTALKGRVSANETAISALETEQETQNTAIENAQKTADAAIKNFTAEGGDGKYVLTAVAAGDQATFKWEQIERGTGE